MIYVYAITEPRPALPERRGLEGAPLHCVRAAGLEAVYSSHAALDRTADPAALWTHDGVAESLMRAGPVLPLRFGTALADSGELRALLERGHARFAALLDRVRGCVELAVRVSLPERRSSTAADGNEYLAIKLAEERERVAAAQRALEPLVPFAIATNMRATTSPARSLSASYLVQQPHIARFTESVRQLSNRNPDLAISCTGPWAPYSFVQEEGR